MTEDGFCNSPLRIQPSYLALHRTTSSCLRCELPYTVNGVPMMFDAAPYLDTKANRSMIPMRFIAEAFGASIPDQTHIHTHPHPFYLPRLILSNIMSHTAPASMSETLNMSPHVCIWSKYIHRVMDGAGMVSILQISGSIRKAISPRSKNPFSAVLYSGRVFR